MEDFEEIYQYYEICGRNSKENLALLFDNSVVQFSKRLAEDESVR
jgi:hypothetical protein